MHGPTWIYWANLTPFSLHGYRFDREHLHDVGFGFDREGRPQTRHPLVPPAKELAKLIQGFKAMTKTLLAGEDGSPPLATTVCLG